MAFDVKEILGMDPEMNFLVGRGSVSGWVSEGTIVPLMWLLGPEN